MQKIPLAFITVLCLLGLTSCNNIFKNQTDSWPDEKATAIKALSTEYIKNVQPVDFSLTYTGFILEPFTQSSTLTLSGWTIYNKDKSQSGMLTQEVWANLYKKWSNWYYDRSNILRSPTGDRQDLTPEKTESIKLNFVPWFTKMRLLWKDYAFNEANLTKNGQIFDLTISLNKWEATVIQLENSKEKANRQALFDEYDKRVAAIKSKYMSDPYTMNSLIDELNKAYQLDATKF